MKKKCFKCNKIKTINKFYKHSQMEDGHINKCIECAKKDAIKNRIKNHDYYIKYDKIRNATSERKKKRQEYMKKHPKLKKIMIERWQRNNPEKRKASHMINNGVRDGKIIKPKICERCSKEKRLIGHHENYNKPLEVIWLCSKCHWERHQEIKEKNRYEKII